MYSPEPYNPLDKGNLGRSVADAMLSNARQSLAKLEKFRGAGIYAIYYEGLFPPYSTIASVGGDEESKVPIYVGKAVPAGARKGNIGLDADPGTVLYKRLKEHADSIEATNNLDIDDFSARFLVVEDIWIPLGESLLIARYNPLWNKIVDGFGNHDPGKGRYQQLRSRWDVLHPGRAWAYKCQNRSESPDDISNDVVSYLRAFD